MRQVWFFPAAAAAAVGHDRARPEALVCPEGVKEAIFADRVV